MLVIASAKTTKLTTQYKVSQSEERHGGNYGVWPTNHVSAVVAGDAVPTLTPL